MTHLDDVVITIDGPAGTGKSTVAKGLADRLGLDFLDTGAMYRAAAAILLESGLLACLDADLAQAIAAIAQADIHFDWSGDPPRVIVYRPERAAFEAIDQRIRTPDVNRLVSKVAGYPEVREHMVRKQQIIAQQHPRLVSEGRDQGSVVFPRAAVKFYLDASPNVRASRRTEQLRAEGHDVDESAVLREIIERDRSDENRSVGPLRCPEDALRVDTSGLEIDEVITTLERVSRERLAGAGHAGEGARR